FKPVRRCLALAQRERFSKVLKHQVNRFRTICTVCGSPPCPDLNLIHYIDLAVGQDVPRQIPA
ncbi:hypothetical protein M5Z06_11010, partial [Neisseria meningitidis]|nr:hypothetical protein [Neisseria meningitidis]